MQLPTLSVRTADDEYGAEDSSFGDPALQASHSERGRCQHLYRLRHARDQPAIIAIGDVTGDQHEYHGGQELRQTDKAEIERTVGQAVHLPADTDGQHLVGHDGGNAPGPVEREGAVAKQRVGRKQPIQRAAQKLAINK